MDLNYAYAEPCRLSMSPAFSVTYPEVRNLHLINSDVRSAMEVSWAKGTFEARPLEVFHLRDVIVFDECLILDRDLRIIKNASDAYTDEEIGKAVAVIRAKGSQVPWHGGVGIMAKRRAANNYGHFLIEMLPMAILAPRLLADLCRASDCTYLLHHVEAPTLDAALRAFHLLGVPLSDVRITPWSEPIHFGDLVIIRGLTEHGRYMSPVAADATASIAESVAPGKDRYLFVRRVPGWKRGRELVNEDVVAQRLEAKGYRVIEPGSMPLEDQIAAFRGAERVVGVMGAAMTNIVFCRPGTEVVVLTPAQFPDVFFWFLAHHRHLGYIEVRGEQTERKGQPLWQGPFSIAEPDIQWLESLPVAPPPMIVRGHLSLV